MNSSFPNRWGSSIAHVCRFTLVQLVIVTLQNHLRLSNNLFIYSEARIACIICATLLKCTVLNLWISKIINKVMFCSFFNWCSSVHLWLLRLRGFWIVYFLLRIIHVITYSVFNRKLPVQKFTHAGHLTMLNPLWSCKCPGCPHHNYAPY